uniref:Uncharacterized protein n=1 Tax=Lepeophtheirus salmonis TaxID=72036 RepID=A0A0K2SWS1_LEPSM
MTYELERSEEALLYVISGYIARSQTSTLGANKSKRYLFSNRFLF